MYPDTYTKPCIRFTLDQLSNLIGGKRRNSWIHRIYDLLKKKSQVKIVLLYSDEKKKERVIVKEKVTFSTKNKLSPIFHRYTLHIYTLSDCLGPKSCIVPENRRWN